MHKQAAGKEDIGCRSLGAKPPTSGPRRFEGQSSESAMMAWCCFPLLYSLLRVRGNEVKQNKVQFTVGLPFSGFLWQQGWVWPGGVAVPPNYH